MKGTLSPAFLAEIRSTARALGEAEIAKSRRQWALGEAANDEWDENARYYEALGWTQDDFNAAISVEVNQAIGFTLITESGETLKMWREVTKQFANIPNLEAYKALPFEYFRLARKLWGMAEKGETVKPIPAPIVPIAEAQSLGITAHEMFLLYVDPTRAAKGLNKNPVIATWGPERKAAFAEALQEFEMEWFG